MNEVTLQTADRYFQAGRLEEAGPLYQQILATNPQHFSALSSLGFIQMRLGRFVEAQNLLAAAVTANPFVFDAWYHLCSAYYRTGQHTEALTALEHALALDPGHVEALNNRAALLLELNRAEPALATSDTALAFRPDFTLALVNRGNALSVLKRYEEAVDSYDAALAIEPNLTEALDNRDHALFELGRTGRCPPRFMRRLFDRYSSTYDTHMVETLRYRAHVHLRTLADRILPNAKPPLRILDLGSGTGLVGDVFKDLAVGGRLVGIDLAPLMIEEAKKRGIYDELVLADLETQLAVPGTPYDLILAADTMIYIGDLMPTFAGVAGRLVPAGHYIFAVEAKHGAGWEQTDKSRFRHSLSYIREEATRAGLAFVDSMECVLRLDGEIPVEGTAVALQKPN